jgi:hypothetical protein
MSSKFSGIFEARKREGEALEEEAPPPSPAPPSKAEKKQEPKVSKQAPTGSKRRGRPPGKRSDDEFVQVTAYIREETHRSVKVALLTEGKGQQFSELVQELLAKWLKSRT